MSLAELPEDGGDDGQGRDLSDRLRSRRRGGGRTTRGWPRRSIRSSSGSSTTVRRAGHRRVRNELASRRHGWTGLHITGEGAVPFGAEFGFTTSAPGFAGWVGHWAAQKEWFDAEQGTATGARVG